MSSPNQVNGRTDMISRDAMYLFELMRDSPHPFLLHIGPYAAKTGTKANSIVKRLGEIKKRNGLNIITTTNAPGDSTNYTTPRPRQTAPRTPQDDNVARPVGIKRERKPKTNVPNGNHGMKTENTPTPAATHNLPTPIASPATTTMSSPPPTNLTVSSTNTPTMSTPRVPVHATPPMQMPLYMPQKRTLSDIDADHYADDEVQILKKVKTETWSFS